MKQLTDKQYKQILLQILKEFHEYCIKHDIKYSLFGGSLIGAVREGGIIPWDDDIDVILMPEEYKKLINCLSKDEIKYRIVSFDTLESYNNLAFKIVDDKTIINEDGIEQPYGAFIDVFRYNYIPNGRLSRKIYQYYYKYKLSIIHGNCINAKKDSIIKKIRNIYAKTKNQKKYIKKFDKFLLDHSKKATSHVVPNGITYTFERETQEAKYLRDYTVVKFDSIEAMIFKHYDKSLTHIFGDYMTPPPKEKRVYKHNIMTYEK